MSTTLVDRATVPEPGPLRPFSFPPIDHLALANGLPLLCARTHGAPVVTFSLLIPAGAIREQAEDAGLATLVGSLLESGTLSLDAPTIAERLEKLGVRVHVGTSWEVSHVDFTALVDRASAASELIAELVRAPSFPDSEVARLRDEQLASIVQRRAEPRSLANEMAARFIYSDDTPFSRPLKGTARSVGALGRDEVASFHARTFSPQDAKLVVAGNIQPDLVRQIGDDAFGSWQGPEPVRAPDLVKSRSDGTQVVLVERRGAVQSEIRVGHVGVARKVPDYFQILVMNTILGGAFSSRLNLNLREKHGFTYGVSSSFVMRRKPGPFIVSTAVQTEVTGRAVGEILTELRRIREGGITDGELSDAKQYVAGTFPLRLQTTDGVASRLAELAIYDLPDSYLDEFAERILGVTTAQVEEAARKHIEPERLTILVVGDPDQVRPQLEALGLGPTVMVRPEELE